ncbi:MAG: bifunctional sugar-1-phosphate nucleotidylyltransferase/acetyltransferase [Methanomassiliicoccales archaeon]
MVLAAGEGTRLRPFTSSRPKVMIPVGNKPILEYVVEALVANAITEIVVVVGYRKERIMSHFADGRDFGASISYVEQQRQLGTAHALLAARGELHGEFLVLPGDNIIDARTVADLLATDHRPSMLVTESETPSKYGVVQVSRGSVTAIAEKPTERMGNIISTGIYRFPPDLLETMERSVREGERGITDALRGSIDRIDLRAISTTGCWIDAVYPWDLIGLNAAAIGEGGRQTAGKVESGVTLKGPVRIGRGTRIRSGSYIEGPVCIGEGCDIGPHAVIFPSTSIGDDVQVGAFTYLSQSLIMSNVILGSHSHLSHGALDAGVRVGPNCSAPSGPSYTMVEEELFRLDEIGPMIGEDSSLGSNVVISPGSIVGASCRVGDGARVNRSLENGSVVL